MEPAKEKPSGDCAWGDSILTNLDIEQRSTQKLVKCRDAHTCIISLLFAAKFIFDHTNDKLIYYFKEKAHLYQ